ncbi:DUF447 domain-containing protein [Aquabacter spiritensis]|uniref:DUF447 family protein n=1 Tax=Aquabacter spiritensis TaxID=933073 RepID=A0A4R3LS43_9HYPH|nr:DUF447 domain-containing protein [Aquabacter spiritensis]TCT02606.1 hypothetical protein EDC64_11239 [Aquabacter spiritensis]
MIREAIVTTLGPDGAPHLAPMGATVTETGYVLQPFRPSRTLDHLAAQRCGVINFTDDARIFAGCITGRRRDWPTAPATRIPGVRLAAALAHAEVEVTHMDDDAVRPRFLCRVVHQANHAPFAGLNRAVAAVIEAAILVSRLGLLDADRIAREMAALEIPVAKTGGPAEREAFDWLCQAVAAHRTGGAA